MGYANGLEGKRTPRGALDETAKYRVGLFFPAGNPWPWVRVSSGLCHRRDNLSGLVVCCWVGGSLMFSICLNFTILDRTLVPQTIWEKIEAGYHNHQGF